MTSMNDFKNDIDWDVYKSQQNAPESAKRMSQSMSGQSNEQQEQPQQLGQYQPGQEEEEDKYRQNIPVGAQEKLGAKGESIFPHLLAGAIGTMQGITKGMPDPNEIFNKNKKSPFPIIDPHKSLGIHKPDPWSSQDIAEMAGGLALPLPPIAKAAKPVAKAIGKGIEYLHPEKAAEAFRNTLGKGTSTENMDVLSKRMQFAKKSAKEEALIPKRKLYETEGESNILTKSGRTGEELKRPRKSEYLKDPDVDSFYSKKGELKKLHDEFKENTILNNYDALQSAIKKEQRKLKKQKELGTLSDPGEAKLDQFNINIKNLDKDKEKYIKSLPKSKQQLENEFREKYRIGVGKYEDAGKKAKNVINNLAKGEFEQISPAQANNVFTRPTKQVKEILKDMGPSAGKNILYNALQKVPIGDAEKLANTILDLKRTKGYDKFITTDMEQWANNMLKQVRHSSFIKKALTVGSAAAAGGAIGGLPGAAIGAAIPLAPKGIKFLADKLRR